MDRSLGDRGGCLRRGRWRAWGRRWVGVVDRGRRGCAAHQGVQSVEVLPLDKVCQTLAHHAAPWRVLEEDLGARTHRGDGPV